MTEKHELIEPVNIRSTRIYESRDIGLNIDYKNILNSITEGIYAIDLHGICVYCNSSCLNILNYDSADDLLGKDMHETIYYTDADKNPDTAHRCKIFDASVQGVEAFADDEMFRTADGRAIPVLYYVYPQFKDGRPAGAVITFSDISGEKNQLSMLEASEARYRNIFNNANSGIIYVDKDGYTISANEAFQDLVQYSLTELQQINFSQIVFTDDWEQETVFREELFEGRRDEYRMDKRYVRKDGKLIWVNVCVSSFQETPSSPLCYVAVVHDINDKKESEQQLLESNAAKDKFFSIIAHDLRNPVGAVKMLSEFIQDELKQNNIREVTKLSEMLSEQVNYTYSLLNNLLEWSRAQTKQISFNPEPLNLQEVIRERVDSNAILAGNKNILLEYDLGGQLMVKADADMLDTILRNLITNAIKFSYENGKITLTAVERANDILITVDDQGKGMPPAILEKLFLADSKTSTPGTNNESGTGLGLLLCKEFVELHGGKIWAESEIGKGSVFFFTMPKVV